MAIWLKELLIGPHIVVFLGIIVIGIAEIIRFYGSKKEGNCAENIGLFILIFGLLTSGIGGWWAAKEQANFENTILSSVTGGDSFCFVLPLIDESSGRTTFLLQHEGNYPIYDISITVTDETKMGGLPFSRIFPIGDLTMEEWKKLKNNRDLQGEFLSLREKAINRFELSILTPNTGYEISRFQLAKELNEQKYHVQIFTRGGKFNQAIKMRRINGLWEQSFQVTRVVGAKCKDYLLFQSIHPEIPIE